MNRVDAPDRNGPACNKPVWTLRRLVNVLPTMPAHLRRLTPTPWNRPISDRLRETLMLAVAAENRCWYCQTAHGVFGRATGLSEREVSALLAGDDVCFPEDHQVALAFVRDLARRGFESQSDELRRALTERFSRAQCEAIEATAHVMNFANRFGNTFDAARNRLLGRPDCSGATSVDLALVSSLFVPAALAVAPWVGTLMVAQHFGLATGPEA